MSGGSVCKECGGTGYVPTEAGSRICKCRLKEMWRSYLGDDLIPRGKIDRFIKDSVNDVLKLPRPRKIMIYNAENRTLGGYKAESFYKVWLAYYLLKSGEFLSFKRLRYSYLLELYLGKVHNSVPDDVVVETFFGYSQKTLVVECTGESGSSRRAELIRLFDTTYSDRNIIMYMDWKNFHGYDKVYSGEDVHFDGFGTDLKNLGYYSLYSMDTSITESKSDVIKKEDKN